jgi:hypothetical protein
MTLLVPRTQLKKAQDYKKTAMRMFLTQDVVAGIREFVELPKGITDGRNMLLMFIDQHIEMQTGKPKDTLNNLVQHALAYRAISGGRKFNLSFTPDEEVPAAAVEEEVEEEKPKKKAHKSRKQVIEIPDDDDELATVMKVARLKLLRQREKQELQQRLAALNEEEDAE